jgi:hypothetical protein
MELWTVAIRLSQAPYFGTRARIYLYANHRDEARSCAVGFTERVAGAIGAPTSKMIVERIARMPQQRPSDILHGYVAGDVYWFEIQLVPAA